MNVDVYPNMGSRPPTPQIVANNDTTQIESPRIEDVNDSSLNGNTHQLQWPTGVENAAESLDESFCADFNRLRAERDQAMERQRMDSELIDHLRQQNDSLQQQNKVLIERVDQMLLTMEQMNRNIAELTSQRDPSSQIDTNESSIVSDMPSISACAGVEKRGNDVSVELIDRIENENRRSKEFKRRRLMPKRNILVSSNSLCAQTNINASPYLQRHFAETIRRSNNGKMNTDENASNDITTSLDNEKLNGPVVPGHGNNATNCFGDDTENQMETDFSFKQAGTSTPLDSQIFKSVEFGPTSFPLPCFGNGGSVIGNQRVDSNSTARKLAIEGCRLNGKTWAQLIGPPSGNGTQYPTNTHTTFEGSTHRI